MGGIVGGYTAVLGSNGNYSGRAIVSGVIGGAFTGALNPIRAISNAAVTVVAGVGGGATAVIVDDVIESTNVD